MTTGQNRVISENGYRYSRHGDVDAYVSGLYGEAFRQYRERWAGTMRFETPSQEDFDHPMHLVMEVIDACDCRCPFCFRQGAYPSSNTVMPPKMFQAALDEADKMGVESLSLSSGESLLHPNITQLLGMIAEKNFMDVFLYTNGLHLTADMIEAILDSTTRLRVSIDAATPETYRAIRGGNYETMLRNLDAFLDAREKRGGKAPLLWVSFVMTKRNSHEKEAFLEQWHEKADIVDYLQLVHYPEKLDESIAAGPEQKCSRPYREMQIRASGALAPCC